MFVETEEIESKVNKIMYDGVAYFVPVGPIPACHPVNAIKFAKRHGRPDLAMRILEKYLS